MSLRPAAESKYQQDITDEKSNSFLLPQIFHNLSQDSAGSRSFTPRLTKSRWVRWYTVVCPRFGSRSRACEVQMDSRSPTTSAVGKDDDRRRISWLSRSWQRCCISWSCCRVFSNSSLSLVASSWRMPMRSRSKRALLPSTSCRRETSVSRSVAGTSGCAVVTDGETGGTSTDAGRMAEGVDGTYSSNRILVKVVVPGAVETPGQAQGPCRRKVKTLVAKLEMTWG